MRDRAAEAALDVVDRMARDPDRRSTPGRALLAARLARADEATAHVLDFVADLPAASNSTVNGSMGAAAAAIAVHATTGDHRLLPAISKGVRWLADRVRHIARLTANGRRLPVTDYDLISGLAGAGRLLLLAEEHGHPGTGDGLETALRTLTDLLRLDGDGRPRWWSTRDDVTRFDASVGPGGGALTGIAHGIAGPLAFLATALGAGRVVTGQADAVRTAATWLLEKRDGTAWPPVVTEPPVPPQPRARWCTGTAGIAAALHRAGTTLGHPVFVAAGIEALAGLAERGPAGWPDVTEPVLCCGLAGVLETALAVRATTPDPRLDRLATDTAGAVLGYQDQTSRYGFSERATVATGADDLLYGAAGTALALLDYAGDGYPVWPALLLLR
jgi:hypothetical protein